MSHVTRKLAKCLCKQQRPICTSTFVFHCLDGKCCFLPLQHISGQESAVSYPNYTIPDQAGGGGGGGGGGGSLAVLSAHSLAIN